MPSPALRRITPARPPPSLRSLLAALTMASTSLSVTSPCCNTIFSAMVRTPLIISEQDLGPSALRLAARNDGRTGALQGIRTNAITGLEQAQRSAAGGLLRFRGGGDLRQDS